MSSEEFIGFCIGVALSPFVAMVLFKIYDRFWKWLDRII